MMELECSLGEFLQDLVWASLICVDGNFIPRRVISIISGQIKKTRSSLRSSSTVATLYNDTTEKRHCWCRNFLARAFDNGDVQLVSCCFLFYSSNYNLLVFYIYFFLFTYKHFICQRHFWRKYPFQFLFSFLTRFETYNTKQNLEVFVVFKL